MNVVVFLGALSALLGATLGLVSLVTQPVTETRLPPDKPVVGSVYYIKGSESNSSRWRTLRSQLLEGSARTLQVSDADLNSWASAMLSPAQLRARPAGEDGAVEAASSLFGLKVNISGVNFRIDEEKLQIGAYIEFLDLAPGKRFAYQVRGTFASGSNGVRFKLEEGTLGRASIGGIPVVGGWIHRTLTTQFQKAPEWESLAGNWAKIESIELAGGIAKMTFK